ncbi:MAG: DUF2520 domain-containing protein [Flavobacteriales bacterium]
MAKDKVNSEIKHITFIGSGNVASAMAEELFKKGLIITQVFSRNLSQANLLSEKVNSEGINNYSQLKETDLFIVAVSDDAISTVFSELKHSTPVVHTSGNTSLLERYHTSESGVFYPLQTFYKGSETNWSEVPICIEAANEDLLKKLHLLGKTLSENVKTITSAERAIIHAAAVLACNFTNHLGALTQEVLEDKNLSLDLLNPLIQKTFRNITSGKAKEKQTGPAVREDYGTIDSHLNILEDKPEIKALYLALSKHIIAYHHGQ